MNNNNAILVCLHKLLNWFWYNCTLFCSNVDSYLCLYRCCSGQNGHGKRIMSKQSSSCWLICTNKVYINNDTGTIFMHHGSHSELYFAFRNLLQLCIRLLHLLYSLSCLQFFPLSTILYFPFQFPIYKFAATILLLVLQFSFKLQVL